MSAEGRAVGKAAEHVVAKAVESAGVRDAEEVVAKDVAKSVEQDVAKAAERDVGGHSLADLERAAAEEDRNGLTRAGRAAQKHGDRAGSVFPKTPNQPAGRNATGQQLVHDILHDPGGRTEVLDRVINIWDSSGRGVRFSRDGKFMGFLEPVT